MRPTARRRTALSLAVAAAIALGASALVTAPAQAVTLPAGPDGSSVRGVDVSGAVNWSTRPAGTQFAYIEATDNAKSNSHFFANWAGATQAGLARGAYSFGVPNKTASNGATQAKYFFAHGGALSTASPYTLRPALDIEQNPNAGTDTKSWCWNLSVAQAQNWITSFVTTFASISGVTPVIYTSKAYWVDCVGNPASLSKYPLWIVDTSASKVSNPGFGGAKTWTLRQYKLDQAGFDYDEFHGTLAGLQSLSTPRVSGSDRWGTSLAASLSFPAGVDTAYVASGSNFPDALAAGAAAGKKGGPVLLTQPTTLPADTRTALSRLKPKHIVVVGGPAAVSSAVSTALKTYSSSVTRLQGADRSATSAAIARSVFSGTVSNAYIAMGTDWPDALSGSALAASAKGAGPMLLVNKTTIPSSVKSALAALKPAHITLLGGTAVLSSGVQTALRSYTASRSASSVTRLSGSDRWATSAAIAKKLASVAGHSATVYAASGQNFPDALVGAPVAARSGSPVLLVAPTALPGAVRTEVRALAPTYVAILGGKASVSASVQSALNSAK